MVRVWNQRKSPSNVGPRGLRLFSWVNVFLNLLRGRLLGWKFDKVLSKLNFDVSRTVFDVLTDLDVDLIQKLGAKRLVGLSHYAGGFLSHGEAAPILRIFKANLARLQIGSKHHFELGVFFHEPVRKQLGKTIPETATVRAIERIGPLWLSFVRGFFQDASKRLDDITASGFVLLISSPASNNPNQTHSPSPRIKRSMLQRLRQEIRAQGKIPVILPHPSERTRIWHRVDWLFAPGRKVIDDLHYFVLIERAQNVVAFGSQLAEDCWMLGKRAIEYRSDWTGVESAFALEKRPFSVNQKKSLPEH